MLFYSTALFAGLLIGLADIFLVSQNKRVASRIGIVLRDAVFVNIMSLAITKYLFDIENIYAPALHGPWYPLKYFAVAICVGIACLFVLAIIDRRVTCVKETEKWSGGNWAIRIISVIVFAIGSAAFFGTIWGKASWGDIAPDEMLISLLSPVTGASDEIMVTLFEGPILQVAVVTAIFSIFAFSRRKLVYNFKEKAVTIFPSLARRIISLILAILVFFGGFGYGIIRFDLVKLYQMYMNASPYIEENFANPRETAMKFPEKKRNLIHIYAESIESSYFSKELGGHMDQNLMPELTELSKEGVHFSHLDKGFGGAPWSTGGTWSVAGMVNMEAGIPMKVPMQPNAYGIDSQFLPGAVTIGDILNAQGYEQTIMFGADADFGGLTNYFTLHGNYNIIDYKAAIKNGWIPSDYHVWWGYEDDKLYEYAMNEITRLYETGKPFHFEMETADTHFPDGYLSPNCPTPYDSQYANVIAFSTAEIVRFVRWIQAQPFYENTTIVITGDHMSMDKKFFENFDPNFERTTFNLILNAAPTVADIPDERTHNRTFASFDMFPTMLASMGVQIEGERLGLGTNLFSGEPTIMERDTREFVNEEFNNRSNFYNENILLGSHKPFDNKNVTYY